MASSVVDAAASPPPPRQTSPPTERVDSQQLPLPLPLADQDSTQAADNDDDLDPAAFLKSVRELSEKREREDNERYRKLEEEIEKGRQERLARRVERASSISPKKQRPETPTSALRTTDNNNNHNNTAVHTPSSTRAAFGSPLLSTPENTTSLDTMANNDPPQRGASGEIDIPEFKGFGSIKRGSTPSTPRSPQRSAEAPETAPKPSPSAGMPMRSNTMKWQQRPTSSPRGARPMSMAAPTHSRDVSIDERPSSRDQTTLRSSTSRPMSMVAPSHSRDVSVEEPQLSRDQIAASLGARDPAYFRQTADRGLGNAAYRKSKDEAGNGEDAFTARRGLPGMSQEASSEAGRATSPAPESVTSDTPTRFGSIREDRDFSVKSSASGTPGRFGSIREDSEFSTKRPTTPSGSGSVKSSDLPFRAASIRSSATNDSNETSGFGRTPTMSASQARLAGSSERPSSPTKGMGGFVQSALMKRSDSQSKRWSAQPSAGLSRADSTASARSGFGGLQGSYSMPKLDPVEAGSRESSHEPGSRPSSSSSNLASLATRPHPGTLPSRHHSRSKSVASTYSTTGDQDGGLTSPLGSPSKRWSPNKSSWIESALKKPDSPKVTPSRPAQPSWMENIARAKAQRGSMEVVPTIGSPNPKEHSRPGSPTKDTPFGPALLKRSDSRADTNSTRSITPPTKAKPSSLSSRPTSMLTQESLQLSEKMAAPTTRDETSNFKLETTAARPSESSEGEAKPAPLSFKKPSIVGSKKPVQEPVEEKPVVTESEQSNSEPVSSPPATKPKPEAIKDETASAADKAAMPPPLSTSKPRTAPKPEPTAKPTTDFRSTLRSRPAQQQKSEDQPEFLSKFGALRKAQQEKYVAPDTLRNNITKGKDALNLTDGPQKRERKDELRDSLLAKKEQWKSDKDAGITHERTPSLPKVTPSKPEALAKRELMGRKESIKSADRCPQKNRNVTPEALRFQKSIREKPKVDAPPPVEKPKPVETEPEPLATEPKSLATPPKPLAAEPKPLATAPKPLTTAPKPLTTTPKPLATEPKPLVTPPKPLATKPEVLEPTTYAPTPGLTKSVTEPVRKLPSPKAATGSTGESKERSASLPRPEEERIASPPIEEKRVASPPASKLAARFNPGLAGILARGPPTSGSSPGGSRSESPVGAQSSRPTQAPASEPPAEGAPLADVRKGRAKGPKKRKGGAASAVSEVRSAEPEALKPAEKPQNFSKSTAAEPAANSPPTPPLASKPSPAVNFSARFGGAAPGPGSAASIMTASLGKPKEIDVSVAPRERVVSPPSKTIAATKPAVSPKPSMTGFTSGQSSPAPAQGSPVPPVKGLSFPKRTPSDKPATPLKDDVPEAIRSPAPAQSSPAPPLKGLSYPKRTPADKPATPLKDDVPEFKGFGSRITRQPAGAPEEDKENNNSSTPSVKDAASMWGAKKAYRPTDVPSQIQLPNRRDEEAALRSASLLASSPAARSPSRPGSSNGFGVTSPITSPSPALPPKPAKSSRIVSGQLKEASPNTDSQSLGKLPETEAERLLVDSFGSWPTAPGPLSIKTHSVLTECSRQKKRSKTLRKTIQRIASDGSIQQLRPQEEYTLFDESVYVCTHTHIVEGLSKASHVIVWTGNSSTAPNVEAGNNLAKAEARNEGSSTQVRVNRQGHEQAELFEALGGILITRRGAREGASKQFMLCGRRHLGHIAFDEVDFAITSLCPAFAYLISFPVTLQETKLYLWKGSSCSSEEVGAARLAAMDLSETGEIIEVDQGAEFASFLKIFGPGTTKMKVPGPNLISKYKGSAPDKFATRLFNIHQSDERAGIFSSMFRRPSWGMRAAAPEPGVKVEVKEVVPFTQSDLDAEGIYLLDAYGELNLLLGPLFFSLQPENVRNTLLSQALLFVSDYAIMSASLEDRPVIPKAMVLFAGCPEGVQWLFRGWDDENGLWGLGGLMAGSTSTGKGKVGETVKSAGAVELVRAVCR